MRAGTGYPPINEYAAIGDTRTVALVSRQGSIDWLCLPDFHSPSVFAAILDRMNGGCLRLCPTGEARVSRDYIDNAAVLRTRFETEGGTAVVTDFMPVMEESLQGLEPERHLLRIVDVEEGAVELDLFVEPRPGYGGTSFALRQSGSQGWTFSAGPQSYLLRTNLEVGPERGRCLAGRTRLAAGERRYVSLSYTGRDIGIVPALAGESEGKLAATLDWWRRWEAQITYDGPYDAAVRRSAMALRLLTCSQSGAVLAAATTSLPEAIGGTRNWDYRYCWLRDAAYLLNAFSGIDLEEEGEGFFDWLMHTTQLTRPRLATLYDIYGRIPFGERELPQFEGYRGSGPVRSGNGAANQLQLDVYGSVITAIDHYRRRGGRIGSDEKRVLRNFGRVVCDLWRHPDDGIWEFRGPRMHTTYSKAMCWAALDCLLRMAGDGVLEVPREPFRREADALKAMILDEAWSDLRQAFTGAFGRDFLDASVLALPRLGLIHAGDERMRLTWDRIAECLGRGPLVCRYESGADGFAEPEGAFVACCFWAVECLAMRGDVAEARARFEALLGYANDLGLWAEEVDPETGELLGNFPQALSHATLILAAMAIGEAEGRAKGSR